MRPPQGKFLGNPCPEGHTERYVSNGGCVECKRQQHKRYYEKYGPPLGYPKAYYTRKLAEDPEGFRKKNREKHYRWVAKNPERAAEIVANHKARQYYTAKLVYPECLR